MRKIFYYLRYLLSVAFVLIFFALKAQTPVSATHEGANQTVITVTFNSVVPSSTLFPSDPALVAANYTLVGAGTSVVSSVFSAGGTNQALLFLNTSLPAGTSSLTVQYAGASIMSINDFVIDPSSHFVWQTTSRPSDVCSPVNPINIMIFLIDANARNSSTFNWGMVSVRVFWDEVELSGDFTDLDGIESDASGTPISTPSRYFVVDAATSSYTYPESVNCVYNSRWLPQYGGITASAGDAVVNASQEVTYASHNNDDSGSGSLSLDTTVSNADLVCINAEVDVTFSDTSTLNCLGTGVTTSPNIDPRWVRVLYGDPTRPDTERIPNIFVGGTQVTDDTGALMGGVAYIPSRSATSALGTGDAFGVVQFPTPDPDLNGGAGALDQITTVTTTAGFTNRNLMPTPDMFFITIEYWNVCNPYTTGNPTLNQVSTSNFIELIDVPPAPTGVDVDLCQGGSPAGINFEINGTSTSNDINWYSSDPALATTSAALDMIRITNSGGTNSSTLPVGDLTAFDIDVPNAYSVWATYVVGTNACESDAVQSTVTVRNDLTISTISYSDSDLVCAGTTGLTFFLPVVSAAETFGGATRYLWVVTPGLSIDGSDIAKDIVVNVGATTLDGPQTVSVYREYTDAAPTCRTSTETYEITVDAAPSVGALSGATTICEGESTGNLTVVGVVGTVARWERQRNGGAFINLGSSFAGLATVSQVLSIAGIYVYRAVVGNGMICTVAVSNEITVTVNDSPSGANLSGTTDICQGDNVPLNIAVTDGTAPFTVVIDNGVGSITWSSSTDDPMVSPTTTTTYSFVSVQDANGCTVSSTGLGTDATISVTNPTEAVLVGDASICSGDVTNLQVTITGGKSPYTITITDNQVSSPDLGTINAYTSGTNIGTAALSTTTEYTLTSVIDADGCPVLSIPTPMVSVVIGVAITGATLNSPDVCAGEEFIFSVGIVGGAPPYSFDYILDGVAAPTVFNYISGQDVNVGVLATMPHAISILMVRENCGTNISPMANENFTVRALPVAMDQTITICSDATLGTTATVDLTSLESTITGGSGLPVIWYSDNSPLAGMIASPASYVVTNAMPVFAEVDDGASPVNCTRVATVTYTVNSRPADPVNPVDAISCSSGGGEALRVDDPGTGYTVRWYTAYTSTTVNTLATATDGVVSGANGQVFTPVASTDATFFATLETTATTCISLGAVSVVNTEDPIQSAAVAQSDEDTCDDSYALSATASTVGTGYWSTRGVLYYQNFESFGGGVTESTGVYGWTRDISALVGFSPGTNSHFDTRFNSGISSNYFEARGFLVTSGPTVLAIWTSAVIDVSSSSAVDISAMLRKQGRLETEDRIDIYYILDGGTPTRFGGITRAVDDGSGSMVDLPVASSGVNVSGNNTLQIQVRAFSGETNEIQGFDDVIVRDVSTPPSLLTFEDIFAPNTTVSDLEDGMNEVTWNVASQYGECALNSESVIITKIAAPVGSDITATFCEDVFSGGATDNIDLSDYDMAVVGGATDRTVVWYINSTRASPVTLVGGSPIVTIDNDEVFYARITETLSGLDCQSIVDTATTPGRVTFTVNPLPTTFNIDDATSTFCEDAPATARHAGVNLETTYNVAIAGGVTADRQVTWYLGYDVMTSTFASPVVVGNAAGETQNFEVIHDLIIYAEIENTATNCLDVAEVTFSVNSLPNVNLIQQGSVAAPNPSLFCRGTTIILFQVDDMTNPGSTYLWTTTDPGIEIFGGDSNEYVTVRLDAAISAADNEFLEVVETTATGCNGPATRLQLVVTDAPVAPTINGSSDVCESETGVVYTVNPASATSTYTWTIPAGASTSGLTDLSSLSVTFGTTSGNIGVTETNDLGCVSPAAIPLPITVYRLPTLNPPPSSTVVCSGESSGITLASTGLPLATGYHINSVFVTPGLLENTANNGRNAGSYTNVAADFIANDSFTNLTIGDLAVTYTITPTTEDPPSLFCDGSQVTVILTVQPEPRLSTSLDATICSEDASGLLMDEEPGSVAATSFNYTVVNPSRLTPGSANVAIPSTTAFPTGAPANYLSNDMYSNTSDASDIAEYTVVPISVTGCASTSATPTVVFLTVNPEPEIDSGLATATVCSGADVGVVLATPTTSIGADRYDIAISSRDANVLGTATPGLLQNDMAIFGDQFTNTSTASGNIVYTVTPHSSVLDGSCVGDPFDITVTINPEPVIDPLLSAVTICSDTRIAVVLATASTSVGADRYDIVASKDSHVGGVARTGTSLGNMAISDDEFTNVTNASGVVVYTITPHSAASGGNCQGQPFDITVTVQPEPVMEPTLSPKTVCSDTAIGITLATTAVSTGAGVYDVTEFRRGPDLMGAASVGTGQPNTAIFNDQFTNISSITQEIVYRIIPRSPMLSGDCAGNPFDITIRIQPEPVIESTLANRVACSDTDIAVTFATEATSANADRYDVAVRTQAPNVIGTATERSLQPSGLIFGDQFTNTSGMSGDIVYIVTPYSTLTNGNCPGDPFDITVTINPEPVMEPGLSTETVCSDTDVGITFDTQASSIGADRYDVAVSRQGANVMGSALIGLLGIDRQIFNDQFTNTSSREGNIVYSITPHSASSDGDCTGDSFEITVTIEPEPVIESSLSSQEACSDTDIAVVFDTEVTSIGADRYDITVGSRGPSLVGTATVAPLQRDRAIFNDRFTNTTNSIEAIVYEVVPHSAVSDGNCEGDSFDIAVMIQPEPVIDPVLSTQTVCSDTDLGITFDTQTGSIDAALYDVSIARRDTDVVGMATEGTSLTDVAIFSDQFTNTSNNMLAEIVYRVTPRSAGDCAGDVFDITVTIQPEPVMSPLLLTKTVCSDTDIEITFDTNGTSIGADRYDVTPGVQDSNVMGTPSMGTSLTDVAIFGDQFTNTSDRAGGIVYQVTPRSAGGCAGNAFDITITIQPQPVINDMLLTQTVCSDTDIGITFVTEASSIGADRYDVALVSQDPIVVGVGPAPTIGASRRNMDIFNDRFTNVGSTVGNIVYEVTPRSSISNGSCLGDPFEITVTIQPEPVMESTLSAKTVCSDTDIEVEFDTNGISVVADRYDVEVTFQASYLIGSTPSRRLLQMNRVIFNDQFTNTSAISGNIVYRVTPHSSIVNGNCVGDPFDITVTIDPEPVIEPSLTPKTVCSDIDIEIVFDTDGASIGADRYDVALVTQGANVIGMPTTDPLLDNMAIFSDDFNNTSNTTGNVVYRITPHSAATLATGDCEGDVLDITVMIQPEPVIELWVDSQDSL